MGNVESVVAMSPINGKGLLISSADKWLVSAKAPQAIGGERCRKGGGHILLQRLICRAGSRVFEENVSWEVILNNEHGYEEIRTAALDLLAGREKASYDVNQYEHLLIGVAEVLQRRGQPQQQQNVFMGGGTPSLSNADREVFLEVFWGLFREGVTTLGMNDSNRQFPFFRVSAFGQRILANQDTYFFHDVSSYEAMIRKEVPQIGEVTLVYLKEAMQAFRAGAILASSVMLGVATEHTFLLMLDTAVANTTWGTKFNKANSERMILTKVTKFKDVLDGNLTSLTPQIREDLDTHFGGILSIIRNFRNQSGHPSGHTISREQCYVLLQLFVPYAKKMYQLREFYG